LIFIFCSAWLIYFRRDYFFPRALLLIPIGLLTIFSLNVVRIAVLMLIGHGGYPDIAIYGFHSQAGWIAFNATACGLVFASRRSVWFARTPSSALGTLATKNPTAVYVTPLLAVLVAGTISHALSASFERFYPMRMIAGVLVLTAYRKQVGAFGWRISWRGPLVGIVVFAVWLVGAHWILTPSKAPFEFASSSPLFQSVWMISHILTSVFIVPIVEEMAYRGFLMRRLVDRDFESVSYVSVRMGALFGAAIAFGLPHGSMWLPATVAGLAYGAVVIRTGDLGEAVAAHATTNLLIAAGVVGWDRWQLW